MNDEFAVFFDNGAWIVLRLDGWGNVTLREVVPSLEDAIKAVSVITGAMVGIKLITKQ